MTIKHLLFALVLGLFFTACGDSGASQDAAEETTTEETTATEESESEEAPAEDTSKRPSPPMTAEGKIGEADVTINYSAPSVRGRTIYGDLVPYNQIWRTGANEATTIETSGDLSIEGKSLPAGKYAVFTIPGEENWTVIFNRAADQWGAYDYDEAQDALRVEVSPTDLEESVEVLQFEVLDDAIALRWADKEVSMAVE
jgi:hypothetical protein